MRKQKTSFESYGKGVLPATPFHEDQPRLDVENFYYDQEDEVFAASARDGSGSNPQLFRPSEAEPVWAEIARRRGLAEADLGRLASAWHISADPCRPIEWV